MLHGKMMKQLILLLGLIAGCSAALANNLTDISYSILSGGKVQIVLQTTEPVSQPEHFATDNPARIAIDLPATRSQLDFRTKKIGSGVARSITAIEAGDKTRVVIKLQGAAEYQIQPEGNRLIVNIQGAEIESDQIARGKGPQIQMVDFRRDGKLGSRVEVTLSDPDVVVDMRKEGSKVVLDFLGATVAPDQRRILDVSDFATVVRRIATKNYRNHARMEIQTKGYYEYAGYQVNNIYTVEFRELTKKEKEKLQKKELVYTGDKLSLNFQDIEVRSVLQLLADFTGLNMVVSDTVTGNITLRLQNVPWDQALDIILKTRGLSMRKNGNVILIAPTEEIAAREKIELESQKQVEDLVPLQSEVIQINYAKATDLANLLKSGDNRLLSERGNVSVDERTNTLLVQDTANKLDEIRQLVKKLDVPVRQVLIESRVVIASDDFARDLGVRFGFNRANSSGDTDFLIGGGMPGYLGGTAGIAPGIENPGGSTMEALLVNLPKTLGSDRGGAINFLVTKVGSYLVQLELSAMQTEGKGEIVSSPRVITSDQNKAVIKQGIEIPYQAATGTGNTTVQFKEAVLQLEVTPHITPDDRVIMDLVVTKDEADFTRAVLGTPPLNTREVKTTVLVDNGETVVLGGIFERAKTNQTEKIPFFGDLPLVGWAFKQNMTTDQKRELLIFVTPKIIKESLTLR